MPKHVPPKNAAGAGPNAPFWSTSSCRLRVSSTSRRLFFIASIATFGLTRLAGFPAANWIPGCVLVVSWSCVWTRRTLCHTRFTRTEWVAPDVLRPVVHGYFGFHHLEACSIDRELGPLIDAFSCFRRCVPPLPNVYFPTESFPVCLCVTNVIKIPIM